MESLSHRRKLARAELHIENVEALISDWLRHGYRALDEPNPEGRFVRVAQQLEPMPDQLALAVGDTLQTLRHSLDHLVFSLARKHTPAMTPKQEQDTEFPIGNVAIRPTDKRIRCLAPEARDDICALAPDPARQQLDQDALWLLHKAGNRDKHRELTVIAVTTGQRGYRLIASDGTDYFNGFAGQRLQLGAPPVPLFEYARSTGVKAEIDVAVEVVFDKGVEVADRQVAPTLQWFHDYIRDTVFQRLEPHL